MVLWRRTQVPVTMRKASFKTLSMNRVSVLRHQTGAQCSAVALNQELGSCTLVRSCVLAPAPHPEPASRLRSVRRVASFLRNALRWWWKVNDLPSFTPK